MSVTERRTFWPTASHIFFNLERRLPVVEKDSGKEGEEGTGVDGETLEEVSTRNDVDEVHRCKRVSSLLRTSSPSPLPPP